MSRTLSRASKYLSWLLRHGAHEAGISMDAAGWCDVADVLRLARLTRPQLEELVRINTKSRIQLVGARVRACQGHSTDGTPVTREALEASWSVVEDDDLVWHGTTVEAALSIARSGISPRARTHVHLAAATNSKVGKRAQVAVLLGIDPARLRAHGIQLYRAPNGVLLTRRVPADCIAAVEVKTRRARAAEGELRGVYGLPAASAP